ncbi:uncharacterized protein EHS24_001879 [Apiotrichum porosum]|uniref:ABC1 atypical kinase-like domain-containing protein n=1 Tax=Apiotrichum porosum TaxID=105984 RepID=A0A427XJD6_9TREE|nr:uncharacterized protein EHS24_001879 [Apiotrichum porosum]RSH78956.1 hypothetical protein EHS24_001879 [Apiotrichum porosum]
MPPRASPTSALRLRRFYTSRAAVDTPPPVSHSRGAPNGSSASLPPKRKQRSTWTQRLLVLGLIGGGVYAYDKKFNASAITRSLRTGYIGLLCTLDYKLNFSPEKANEINELHERVAKRLRWVIDTNQGLYLKLGQAIGLQAALLPKPYRDAFFHVFDNAPSVPYEQVVQVFRSDLGIDPMDVFGEFSKEALASASVAQVHRAVLRPEAGNPDQVVAVKVQKPAIAKQMEWDLFSYKSLMWLAQKAFDLPLYFVADYVSSQMRFETSFTMEAANARKCAALLAQTPELRDDVYVPRIYGKEDGYPESDRILVMEWVDGCRLNDKKQIEAWGLDPREVMDLAIGLNGAMTFSWGFVHCDPHPGNILVRPHPWKKGKPQIVVLDHGLYITLRQSFREEYATLWRSMFVLDIDTIEKIGKKWGLGLDPNMFASAIMLRPTQVKPTGKKGPHPKKSEYELQLEVKAQFKAILESEQLIPKELIFLTRCQRMMQANNQTLGSPSSRVNVTAQWAARGYANSLTGSRALSAVGFQTWLKDRLQMVVFRFTLWVIDVAFWWTKLKQRWGSSDALGWEDRLQKQMESLARDEFGIEIDDTVFLG